MVANVGDWPSPVLPRRNRGGNEPSVELNCAIVGGGSVSLLMRYLGASVDPYGPVVSSRHHHLDQGPACRFRWDANGAKAKTADKIQSAAPN
jgi:hypothetical protein